MFSSNKISHHNLNSNIPYRPYTVHTIQTQHCSWTPKFLHTAKTDHICHVHYSKYTVHCNRPQHNPLPMHIKMHSQHYPPHCLPQPSSQNQEKRKAYLCKRRQTGTRCRDSVKVLWCHSHLVWLVF